MRNPITAFFSLFKNPTVGEELARSIAETRRQIIQLELMEIDHAQTVLAKKKRLAYLEKAYSYAGGNVADRGTWAYSKSEDSPTGASKPKRGFGPL